MMLPVSVCRGCCCWCQCVVTQPKPWCCCRCQCVVTAQAKAVITNVVNWEGARATHPKPIAVHYVSVWIDSSHCALLRLCGCHSCRASPIHSQAFRMICSQLCLDRPTYSISLSTSALAAAITPRSPSQLEFIFHL